MRLGARALLGLFDAISLAVAKVVIVESGADYFFVFRILAAARLGLRRLAPALTSGVDFTILLAAFAVAKRSGRHLKEVWNSHPRAMLKV